MSAATSGHPVTEDVALPEVDEQELPSEAAAPLQVETESAGGAKPSAADASPPSSPLKDPLDSPENRKSHLNFYSTTYKTSFFSPTTPKNRSGLLPLVSGYNRNFAPRTNELLVAPNSAPARFSRRSVTASGSIGGRKGSLAITRKDLAKIRELTGYQSNFGPNVAAFLSPSHNTASMRTPKPPSTAPPRSSAAEAHDWGATRDDTKYGILARSWEYQSSGYYRNGILPRFDQDPERHHTFVSTTTDAFPSPTPALERKALLPVQRRPRELRPPELGHGGYNKELATTRLAMRPGDRGGNPRMQRIEAGPGPGGSGSWNSTKKSEFLSPLGNDLTGGLRLGKKPTRRDAPRQSGLGYVSNFSSTGLSVPAKRYRPEQLVSEVEAAFAKLAPTEPKPDPHSFSLSSTWLPPALKLRHDRGPEAEMTTAFSRAEVDNPTSGRRTGRSTARST